MRECDHSIPFWNRRRLRKASSIPISLLWTQADSDNVTCCVDPTPRRNKVGLFNGTLMDASTCFVSPGWSVGSPYLIDGCDVGGM
ncbi:hypothetical protein Hanom_Chr11g01055921 [Helianthus anomalus]